MNTTAAAMKPAVFLVDDSEKVRESIRFDLESVGYRVMTFASGRDFLDGYDPEMPGCLILDIRMPGMTGLELQDVMKQKGYKIPTIIISGHGDVPMAVRAMKAGAVDFLCKPVSGQSIIELVNKAFSEDSATRKKDNQNADIIRRHRSLTPREKEVLEHVLEGMSSREIAEKLGVSFKTVEAHRANISRKMQAKNVAHLIHMVKDAGVAYADV